MGSTKNIFERMLEGGVIPPDDPQFCIVTEISSKHFNKINRVIVIIIIDLNMILFSN